MAEKDVNTMKISPVVWKNGEVIKWDEARIHVMSHVVHYGSSVFEGIRCYETSKGSAVFRLPEHIQRLLNSAKIYRMDPTYSRDEIIDRIAAAQEEVNAAFRELKKYELVLENWERRERQKQERREQAEMDEAGLQGFRRRQERPGDLPG